MESISLEEFRALASESEGQDDAADLFRWIEGKGDGDGELTVDEWVPFVLEREKQRRTDFRTMVDAMLGRLARKKRETLLRQVFLKMDADSSGSVDRAEFDNLKDGEDDDARLNMIYSYLDAAYGDADGELSSDEWVHGMKAMGEDMDDEHFEAEVSKWMAALAKNQRKVWRGVYSRGNARDFVVAARAAGLTHAIFVQSAHASFDGFATGAEEWAPLKHALVSLSPKKQEEDAPSPPLPPPPESKGKGGLARPSSSSVLRPTTPNVQRPSSAHPRGMTPGNTQSTPALELAVAAEKPPAAAARAWGCPDEEGAGDTTEGVEPPLEGQLLSAANPLVPEPKLTHRGTAQCMLARSTWFKRFPMHSVMMSSPARCTRETALHLAGRLEEAMVGEGAPSSSALTSAAVGPPSPSPPPSPSRPPRATPLTICKSLAPSEDSSICAALIKGKTRQMEVKEGKIFATAPPLHALLAEEGAETAFGLYAEGACAELAQAVRGPDGFVKAASGGLLTRGSSYLSVFGHAGYTHAIAYAVATAAGMGPSELDDMMRRGVGDMEGILVPLFGGAGKPAILMKRPK